MVSISACHAEDPGSIPGGGGLWPHGRHASCMTLTDALRHWFFSNLPPVGGEEKNSSISLSPPSSSSSFSSFSSSSSPALQLLRFLRKHLLESSCCENSRQKLSLELALRDHRILVELHSRRKVATSSLRTRTVSLHKVGEGMMCMARVNMTPRRRTS